MQKVIAYCDGACSGNGTEAAEGGAGVLFVIQDSQTRLAISSFHISKYYGTKADYNVTNNTMEINAVIVALAHASDLKIINVHIVTDSKYVVNGITSWISGWRLKGWKTASGSPVLNKELWQSLDYLTHQSGLNVTFEWVRGHDGHPGNEMADRLAVYAITNRDSSVRSSGYEESASLIVKSDSRELTHSLDADGITIRVYSDGVVEIDSRGEPSVRVILNNEELK